MSERILITGGTGFVGSHLFEHLLGSTDLSKTSIHLTHYGSMDANQEVDFSSAKLHAINLLEYDRVLELFELVKPTQVYHLAALASVGQSFDQASKVITANTQLQLNVLEAIAKVVPSCRVLIIGSAEEYGVSLPDELPISENHPLRPVNPYGVSKVTQDLLAYSYTISHSLQIVRVRPFNHTGERQTAQFAIPAFASQIVEVERGTQESVMVGSLEAKRDISDVLDVAKAYELLMRQGKVGEVYNLGSGFSISMKEVLAMMIQLSTSQIITAEDQVRMRPSDIPIMVADISRIKELGWQPTIPLENTLQRVLEWWRKQK